MFHLVLFYFIFPKWDDNSDPFVIALLLIILNWMILLIFIPCELGARMINQVDVFSDELGQCDWYLLTIELQRMYAIFLSDTQNPMEILSYADITCERDTSKKVSTAQYTYI